MDFKQKIRALFEDTPIHKIIEGGNVTTVSGVSAEKIDLSKVNRTAFVDDVTKAFLKLNKFFEQQVGTPLWGNFQDVLNGEVLNGSSRALFQTEKYSDEQYIEFKPIVGDIDIMVPEEHREPLFNVLAALENKVLFSGNGVKIIYIGNNKQRAGDDTQFNTVFEFNSSDYVVNFQVDFEMAEFDETGSATEFSKFSHSSHWDDISNNIKSVHHKYLLKNLARIAEPLNVSVATPASAKKFKQTGEVEKLRISTSARELNPSNLKFSVDRGVRTAYTPLKINDTVVQIDGKEVWEKMDTKDSVYEKSLTAIYELFFKVSENQDLNSFGSFKGLLGLMKKHLSSEEVNGVFNSYIKQDMFGFAAQGLEKNNPKEDAKIKWAGINAFIETFPELESKRAEIEAQATKYADNYRMT